MSKPIAAAPSPLARVTISATVRRGEAAARAMFDMPESGAMVDAAAQSDLLYFSLITLAILPDAGREAFVIVEGTASVKRASASVGSICCQNQDSNCG